jgi:hypothetical protein
MKKGLLTVLLASLVLVGCQNYDDQFDDLNAQISALKSQVDGLSSLSGQVSSLSGTISGLQSGISAATAAATAAGASADANATAIAAATAAATAAGASADAATAAATAATTAATEAVAAGASNATAIAAATAAATAAGVSADAATAAADAATAAVAGNSTDLTALSASLTALAADVAAVQTAIASASTSAEVAALQAEIDAIEADLDDLLTSNNVYASDITINSAASMASALALGNKVNLMNGDVNITDDATIADADIQTFIDRLLTMGGAFRYDSGSATGYAPTFDKMVAATTIDVESAGPISFKALASATTVTLPTTYTTKITSLDMSALASVTTFSSGTDGSETANNITLASATNIDLGALTMYNVASAADVLTVSMKKGGTLDIASLTGTERTTGLEEPLSLTISGPASLNISKIADGTLTVSDVAALTVSGFYGTLDVNGGVETLTTTDLVTATLEGAVDVVTATLDFKYDWDPSLTTAQAAVADDLRNTDYLQDIAATGDWVATDLKTLTVTGELLDLYLDEGNLETLSIDATMHDLTLSSNTDLTSLTVASGSKIGNISMTGNNNLEVADFNHTTNLNNKLSGATAGTSTNSANLSATLSVTNNTSLTKLHSTGDDVGTLTVTGNTALAELDFTGLADDGGDLTPAANVYNNALVAVSASNTSDGDTNRAAGLTTDLGSFDDGTSGMSTLKTYLSHVVADSDFAGMVSFDTLNSEVDTETSGSSTTSLNITYQDATTTTKATVLYEVAADAGTTTTTGGAATKGKRGFLLDVSALGSFQVHANGGALIDAQNDGTPAVTAELAVAGNTAAQLVGLINQSQNLSRATNNGVTMLASAGGNSVVDITIGGTMDSAVFETETAVASAFALSTTETITLTVGNFSVDFAPAGTESGGEDAFADAARLAAGLRAAANTEATGDSVNYYEVTIGAVASATATGSSEVAAKFTVTSKDIGTGGADLTASLSVAGKASQAYLPYIIGASRSTADNVTAGPDVVLTIEWNTAGTDTYPLGTPANDGTDHAETAATVSFAGVGATGAAINELYTTHFPNAGTADATGTNTYPAESRSDVTNPEQDNLSSTTTGTVTAVAFNRLAWLN